MVTTAKVSAGLDNKIEPRNEEGKLRMRRPSAELAGAALPRNVSDDVQQHRALVTTFASLSSRPFWTDGHSAWGTVGTSHERSLRCPPLFPVAPSK